MIYENKPKPVFDDTIIRGVDKIVNGMYYNKREEYRNTISEINFLYEFRSAFLSLPRQTGKTTYIKKLYSHLKNNMGHNPVIIVKRQSDKVNSFVGINHEVMTMSEIKDIRGIMGKQFYYDVLLFDEVPLTDIEAKGILESLICYPNRLVGPKIEFILGLYT